MLYYHEEWLKSIKLMFYLSVINEWWVNWLKSRYKIAVLHLEIWHLILMWKHAWNNSTSPV